MASGCITPINVLKLITEIYILLFNCSWEKDLIDNPNRAWTEEPAASTRLMGQESSWADWLRMACVLLWKTLVNQTHFSNNLVSKGHYQKS